MREVYINYTAYYREVSGMNEKASPLLYAQIKELINQCTGKYEPGIMLEIQDLLRGREDIQAFTVSWDRGGFYHVVIVLKEYSPVHAKKVFTTLVTFIEYEDTTLYVREKKDDTIHFLLASLTKSGLHFACQIDFS